MDILDDWTRGQALHPPAPDGDIITGVEAFEVLDAEAPIFSIDRVDRQISRCSKPIAPSALEMAPRLADTLTHSRYLAVVNTVSAVHRGRGQVAAVAAANDCVVVATSRAYVLRYDLSEGSASGA